MGQASVLTETEIRRVFRIIATTRHAERNRLAFVLSIYSGLRVGEIAALTVGDVATRMAMFAAKSNSALIKRKDRKVEQSFYQSGFGRRSVHSSRIRPSAIKARRLSHRNAMIVLSPM